MVEALAVFFVVVVATIALIITRIQVASVKVDPATELDRLQHYVEWLEQRWRHAEEQSYDDDMKAQIMDELLTARRQLAEVRAQLR